jgi:arylsulfatase A-like enzyme
MGVSLILRGPEQLADGIFSGGRAIDAMISQIDLFPTICELLDIDQPDWLQGKSMIPALDGSADEINDEIFAEVSYHAAYEPKRAVRTQRYKYIRRYVAEHTGHGGMVLANCDDSVSKDVWLEHGWRERTIPNEQLYDLAFDPNEANNVADDPGYQDVLMDMQRRLQAWMEQTDDPLLSDEVPMQMPPGAVVNKTDAISPGETPGLFAVTV